MHDFSDIVKLLDERFPGRFFCELGKKQQANGLYIKCSNNPGHVFVYESNQDGSRLLSIYNHADDPNPEVWNTNCAVDILIDIHRWAFPKPWTLPAPIDRKQEKKRLEKIAASLALRGALECQVNKLSEDLLGLLTEQGRKSLESNLQYLSPARIALNFPWDSMTRLALKTTVLLNTYTMIKPPGKDRSICLAAIGPVRRQDEQIIRIELTDLIVVNQSHRWESCPWLWMTVNSPVSELCQEDTNPEDKRVAQSLDLLDEGRIEEALMLYGVTLSEDLHRLIGDERISPPACCAHADETWISQLVATLRQSAPWLLPKAVKNEAERLKRWADEKSGRKQGAPNLKLLIFPGQFHQRKASLMLRGDKNGDNPHFVIEATASNARLPDIAWKRPIKIDFLRYGIAFPAY
ncbi:MAG: hypothetical protein AB1489_39655 [Acidobacteriota bacterium]